MMANIIRPGTLRLHDLSSTAIYRHAIQITLLSRESNHPRETKAGMRRLHAVSINSGDNFAMGIWSVCEGKRSGNELVRELDSVQLAHGPMAIGYLAPAALAVAGMGASIRSLR